MGSTGVREHGELTSTTCGIPMSRSSRSAGRRSHARRVANFAGAEAPVVYDALSEAGDKVIVLMK